MARWLTLSEYAQLRKVPLRVAFDEVLVGKVTGERRPNGRWFVLAPLAGERPSTVLSRLAPDGVPDQAA